MVLRFGPRLYFQDDNGFEDDDNEDYEDEEVDNKNETDDDRKYHEIPESERVSANSNQDIADSGITHRHNYEMNDMSHASENATTLVSDRRGYGATDLYTEENVVARLLEEDQRRQFDKLNHMQSRHNTNNGPPFLSWLSKLIPGKRESQRPLNPYQMLTRDHDVVRLMKKKKSLGRMTSRPSFCT